MSLYLLHERNKIKRKRLKGAATMKLKKLTALTLAGLLGLGALLPLEAEAKMTTLEKAALIAAATYFVGKYLADMDTNGTASLLTNNEQKTGVYDNPEYTERVQTIYNNLAKTGNLSRDYSLYVSPSEELNAFMSLGGVFCVHKGAMDMLDDDELAAVMGHELAHGEKRHVVGSMKKSIGLETAVDLYLSENADYAQKMLGSLAVNGISNGVFTKDNEKEADKLGFEYATKAGYNPGGGAAAMEVIFEKYGAGNTTGLESIILPGGHPLTKDRVNKNLKWMTAYSGNHVVLKDDWILINNEKTFSPEKYGKYSAKERACLTAGKLARLYHEGNVKDAIADNATVKIGDTSIYTAQNSEEAGRIAQNLNKAIQKDRGTKVEDHFEIDKVKGPQKDKTELAGQ